MTTPTKFLLACTLAAVTPLAAGCDSESSEAPMDYRAVAHVDIAAAQSAAWVKSALGSKAVDLGAEVGPCADIVRAATSVTAGFGGDEYEIYVLGKFDAAKADACAEFIENKAGEHRASSKKKTHKSKPEAVLLDGDLFVIHGGALSPSRARMETLLASDPSPSRSPIWAIAHDRGADKHPVKSLQAWADTRKGLDVHADVAFDSETKATELYGQAMLGLAAMQFSGEAAEFAKTISLRSSGDTLSADLKASPKLLQKLIDAKSAKVKAEVDGSGTDKDSGSLSITIGTD